MTRLRFPDASKVVPVVFALIAIALVIAAIVTIIRITVFNDGSSSEPVELDYGRTALLSSSAGRSVRMTVRGKIVGDEDFRSFQIEVSPTNRTIYKSSGYMGAATVVATKPNNIAAYEQFVNALDKANLMKGDEFPEEKNDIRGICATGYLYNFELFSYNTIEKNLWTSTCSGSRGSLRANLQQIYDLFTAQIPGSQALISKIWQ